MKKTKKEFEDHVEEIISKWKPILKLQNNINVVYKKDQEWLGIEYRYPYMDCNLYYGDQPVEDFKNDLFPERAVVHELSHLLIEPLYVKAINIMGEELLSNELERVVDLISMILYDNIGD